MKQFFALAILFGSTLASAAEIQLNGQFAGNDNEAAVEAAILAATGDAVDLTLYDKSDEPPALVDYTGNNGSITNSTSGTWDVVNPSVLITYMTVKAGPNFTVWGIDPAANAGGWTTAGLTNPGGNQPTLSHISLWTGGNGGGEDPVIPEPMSMSLMGGGLIGIVLYRKYRK